MDDLISRQAAIDAIPQRIKGLGGESWMMTYRRSGYNDCVDACLDAIRNLPSTQQEQKKGKWIDNTYCSECGWVHETDSGFIGSVDGFNFCPQCGADMRERKKE